MKNRITLLTGGLLFCTVLLFSCANGSSDDLLAKIETTENKATETTSDESKAKEINPIAKTLFGNSYVISKVISTYNSNFKHYAEFDKKEEIVSNGIKTVTFYKNGTKTKTETEQFETVEHIFYKDFTGRFNGKNITWEVNSDNTVKCSATQDGQSYSINISSTDNFETWSVTIENSDGTMVCYVKKYSTGNEKGKTIITTDPNLVTTSTTKNTVWTGNSQFLYNNEGWYSVPDGFVKAKFSGVQAGDQILITHKSNTASDFEYRALELAGYDKWNNAHFTMNGKTTNATIAAWEDTGYIYFRPYSATQTTEITLSASDAKIVNDWGGITMWGCGYTITKIEVISDTLVSEIRDVTFKTPYKYNGKDVAFRIEGKGQEQAIAVFLFWDYNTYYQRDMWGRFAGGTNMFHMEASYTFDNRARNGTLTITSVNCNGSNVPEDTFTQDAVFTFTYPFDKATITLVPTADPTKSYTFTYDSEY